MKSLLLRRDKYRGDTMFLNLSINFLFLLQRMSRLVNKIQNKKITLHKISIPWEKKKLSYKRLFIFHKLNDMFLNFSIACKEIIILRNHSCFDFNPWNSLLIFIEWHVRTFCLLLSLLPISCAKERLFGLRIFFLRQKSINPPTPFPHLPYLDRTPISITPFANQSLLFFSSDIVVSTLQTQPLKTGEKKKKERQQRLRFLSASFFWNGSKQLQLLWCLHVDIGFHGLFPVLWYTSVWSP